MIIDLNALMNVLELNSVAALRTAHREWVEEALRSETQKREDFWSESVAVGSNEFAMRTQAVLGLRGRSRDVSKTDVYVLREAEEGYSAVLGVENRPIFPRIHFWGTFIFE